MRTTMGLRIALLVAAAVMTAACTSTPTTGGATPTTGGAAATATGPASTEAVTPTAEASVPQSSAVVSSDPCALITQDEAATFLGGPIANHSKETSQPFPGVNLTTCTFNTASAAGILVIGLARPFNWDQFLAGIPPDVKNGLVPVSGIGDAAWFLGPVGDQSALIVRKGDAFVEVVVTLQGGASTDDLDKQVAQLALTRL